MTVVRADVRKIADLPGPKGWPLIGNLRQLDPPRLHRQLEAWAREFGPIYRVRFGPDSRVCIADLDTIHHVLRERPDLFRRRRAVEVIMEEMGANGVFSQDGERWRRQRKLMAHALNPAHLARFYPTLARTTERLRQRWLRAAAAGTTVDACRDLMRYTVDITAELAFGLDVNTLETEGPIIQQHLDKVFPMLFRRVLAPFPLWRYWKRAADRELDRSLAVIHRTIRDIILDCRARMQREPARHEQPANFLEAILAGQRVEGLEFSDEEIQANVMTIFMAGEDTTANSLAWAMKYFIDYPQVYARVRAEADAALAPHAVAPSWDALRDLDYIEAATHETMRLKPVAPLLVHEPKQDIELLGCHLPAGTAILLLVRANALDDAHFADAQAYRPERWLAPRGAHEPRATMPFGAGPRFCPGRGLALLEIKAVIAMLARNFDLAYADANAVIQEKLAFTMLPDNLNVRLTARA